MSYIDIFIPLSIGILGFLFPDVVIPKQDASYEKKKSLLKKSGLVLIGVSLIYFLILLFESK